MHHDHVQVLADAAAVDAKAARGESIRPLCGLPIAVKDSIDVKGYPTTASTPAFLSKRALQYYVCMPLNVHTSRSPLLPK